MSMIIEMWNGLFRQTPKLEDIKLQLKSLERDQKKKRRELDIKSEEQQDKLGEAAAARKKGKDEVVRDIFREMRQIEVDKSYVEKDLRRLSLAKMALTSFERKLEMLEKHQDRKSMAALIMRFHQDPQLIKALDSADVDDETFTGILEDVLGEEEEAAVGSKVKEDSGIDDFYKTLDSMNSGVEPDHQQIRQVLRQKAESREDADE